MRLIALIPQNAESHLRSVLPPTVRLQRCVSIAAAFHVLGHAETDDQVLVDPRLLSRRNARAFVETVLSARLGMLVYVSTGVRALDLIELAGGVDVELLFMGAPEERMVLRRFLRESGMSVPARLLNGLLGVFGKLPVDVAIAALHLFGWCRPPKGVGSFCRAIGMSRRALERIFARAGIPSLSGLLIGAQMGQAWHLVEYCQTAEELAERTGVSSPRLIASRCKKLVGKTLHQARRDLAEPQFVDQTLRSLVVPRSHWQSR